MFQSDGKVRTVLPDKQNIGRRESGDGEDEFVGGEVEEKKF